MRPCACKKLQERERPDRCVCVCLCAHICIFVVVARQSGWIGKGRPTNYGYGSGWEVRCVIMKVTNAVVAFVHIGQVLQ